MRKPMDAMKQIKILVVDDEAPILKVYRKILDVSADRETERN